MLQTLKKARGMWLTASQCFGTQIFSVLFGTRDEESWMVGVIYIYIEREREIEVTQRQL